MCVCVGEMTFIIKPKSQSVLKIMKDVTLTSFLKLFDLRCDRIVIFIFFHDNTLDT